MANDITRNPIHIDTAGVITTQPLWIKKIVLVPTATTGTAVLKYWEEDEGSVRATMQNKTASGTDADTLTSTGNFEAAEAVVTDAIKIYASSTGNNLGTWAITVVTDNAIDVAPATLTTEASSTYSWKTYASYPLASLNTATFPPQQMDFDGVGFHVPNLMVTTLTSGKVYIYL